MPTQNITTVTKRYYPTLSSIISEDDIPEILGFIREGIQNLLGKIHYKDLQYSKSPRGDAAFYSLSVVSPDRIDIEIPGTGIYLILNPDLTGGDFNISSFPITVEYQWKILAYLREFSVGNFSFAPQEIFEIALRVLNISEEQALANFINTFVTPANTNVTPLQQFITDLNANNPDWAIPLPAPTENTKLADIATHVFQQSGKYSSLVAFESFILDDGISETSTKVKAYFKLLLPRDIDSYIKDILVPKFRATLTLTAGIEFPRNMLVPVDIVSYDPIPAPAKALFTFGEALFYADTTEGFGYKMDLVINTVTPVQIGNTGLVVNIENLKVDLSKETNFPEADADGRPKEFMGVYADKLEVILPKKWFKNTTEPTTLKVFANNLLAGTGGISGTLGLKTIIGGNAPGINDVLWFTIGSNEGFKIGFTSFDITFRQNQIVTSNIQARLVIKKFVYPSGENQGQPVNIGVTGHLDQNGDFNLTASAQPPYDIVLPEVFVYGVKSVELGKEDDDFYIGTSGTLQFEGFLKDFLKIGPIEIDRLRIYSDGSFELVGGSIQLIDPIVLPLGPVEITVTAIHYGSIQKEVNGEMRKFNYFGFDGGISIDPLGVEVRGDGVKYYYCVDEKPNKPKPYLHIKTLYLDLTLPANSGSLAIINGWVSIPEPGVSKEYAGGIAIQIPKAKLAGKADIKLAPRYPAFLLDCEIEPPVPITLGTFAIYGFRGLLGYRYVAEKEAIGMVSGQDSWFDYYKFPKQGINVHKFSGPDKTKGYGFPVSLGAGATLGTSADNGFTFSIKAFVLVSIPSLFMIDGKAAILAKRMGLDESTDPPFFAFLALGDDSLEFGLGADYKLQAGSGEILEVYAMIQMGFFFKNQRPWYINIGTNIDQITARIISLITIKSYVMISARGIEAGARGEFDFDRNYGVIIVQANAFIEIGGRISFERPQFGSYLMAGVSAKVQVLFISLELVIEILFGVEAPKPFLIYGKFYFSIKVGIKILGKRITLFKFSGELEVLWNLRKEVDTKPVNPLLGSENPAILEELVQGVNMLTNEKFLLKKLSGNPALTAPPDEILNYIIPLDTYIDIKTEKGLLPGNISVPNNSVRKLIGGVNNAASNYVDLIPPVSSIRGREIRQVSHQYSIEHIEIKFWNTQEWKDYHPYEALYPNDSAVSNLKIGQFQKVDGMYNAVRLLATTPFSYTEQGQPGWYIPEQYGITPSTLFCEAEKKKVKFANFLFKALNARYYCANVNTPVFSNDVAFKLITGNQEDYAFITAESNTFNFAKSLAFTNTNSIEIVLPEPSIMVALKISNFTSGVRIKFYSVIHDLTEITSFNVNYGNPNPDISGTSPYELLLFGEEANSEIRYNIATTAGQEWRPAHSDWKPVSRIIIEPIADSGTEMQIDFLSELIASANNNNELISLGLVDGEIVSTLLYEEEIDALFCSSNGTSKSFVNRYVHPDALNYRYSKEFIEDGANFIYSVGISGNRLGLITKSDELGNVVWEKSYTNGRRGSVTAINRIIQVQHAKFDPNGNKSYYIAMGAIGDANFVMCIDPVDGSPLWFKYLDWDDRAVLIHIAAAINEDFFYIVISDRNEIDIKREPIILKIGLDGNYLYGTALKIPNEEFIVNAICETPDGVALAGRYIEGDYLDSVGTVVQLNKQLEITNTIKIGKRYTTVHDIEWNGNGSYLVSGYDSERDAIFMAVTGAGFCSSLYYITDSAHHRSSVQIAPDGYYLLQGNNHNGILHFIGKNFRPIWSKSIHLKSGSNGLRTFTYNRQTAHLTLNCFNPADGSLVVHANKYLHTCRTINASVPHIDRLSVTLGRLIVQQDEFDINLRYFPILHGGHESLVIKLCSDTTCEPEPKLCELHSYILDLYTAGIPSPEYVSEEFLDIIAESFKRVLEAIEAFDPNYDLLGKLYGHIEDINFFLNKRILENYPAAWRATDSILQYLDSVGNCDCSCKPAGNTMIHEVTWLSHQDYIYNINIPSQAAIAEDAEAAIAGITQHIQPIWRPNTSYYIHFILKDLVNNQQSTSYPYTYGFTTGGPVGYFHAEEKSTYGDVKLLVGDRLSWNDPNQLPNDPQVPSFLTVTTGGLARESGTLLIANNNGFILEDTTGYLRDAVTKTFITISGPNAIPARLQVTSHPEIYPLTSLNGYIDYTRSYPNADGNLLSSKPLFYDDRIHGTTQLLIFFSKAYATHFFHSWRPYKAPAAGETPNPVNYGYDGRLKIVIKDPVEDITIENPPYLDYDEQDTLHTNIPQTVEEWKVDTDPQVPFAIRHYLNLYNLSECIGQTTVIKPASEYLTVQPKHLKPNKLYTAIVNNLFDMNQDGQYDSNTQINEIREVHRYVFKTSRYKDFESQVNSYYLRSEVNGEVAERDALFRMGLPLSSEQVNAAYAVVSGQAITGFTSEIRNTLETGYQHSYDKIFEGIFGFKAWNEPISTEVNIIRDTNSNTIIALIIRNPEPFNDPKTSTAALSDTITVVTDGAADPNFKLVHSKDCSQVIIMHNSLTINAGELKIQFLYKLWDGSSYAVKSSVILQIQLQ